MSRKLHVSTAAAALLLAAVQAHAQPNPGPPIAPDDQFKAVQSQHLDKLSKVTPVTDAMLQNPPASEWLLWRRTYDNLGFSPLTQINTTTVKSLSPAWSWSLPDGTTENTPLEHDGVLFVYGNGDKVQALDAVSGDFLWEYDYPKGKPDPGIGGVKRNIAIYGDRIYFPTSDNHMIALDIKTGKAVWEHAYADPPYQTTGGPTAVKGKIIQGVTNCSRGQPGGCYIVGLDAATGQEAWRLNTIARPGEPGGDSWNGLPLEKRYGASVWIAGGYDPKFNLFYTGVGNTYEWQELLKGAEPGKSKPGTTTDALYTDSTLAINPDTGKLVWHYQHFNGDLWDMDWSFERQLVDLKVDGVTRKVSVTANKMAVIDVLDAETGKYEFSKDLGMQNIIAKIDPVTGKKTSNPDAIPAPGRNNFMCPSGNGFKSWPSSAINPATKVLFMPMIDSCALMTPTVYGPNDTYKGGSQEIRMLRRRPDTDGNFGRLEAINLQTREVVWTKRQRAPRSSPVLATAGGVLFSGSEDRVFGAYDQATGKTLWETKLNGTISSFPITYSVGGKQYVAVIAGSGATRLAYVGALTPELQTRSGGAVLWVFEVPSKH